MSQVNTTEILIDLMRRMPILPIDMKTAETEGDLPAIAYQRTVAARGDRGRGRDPVGQPQH